MEHDADSVVAPARRPLLRWRVLLAGVAFLPAWVDVSVRFAYLGDVLAVLVTAVAIAGVTRRWAIAAGVPLTPATLCKPWATAFLPLLLALPNHRRDREERGAATREAALSSISGC